ncbi:MAG: hypothetical protein ACOX4O_08190 [Eubacteriales bacterium]|jgi:hypothetical protein
MIKKAAALILAAMTLLTLMTACSSKESEIQTEPSETAETVTEAETTEPPLMHNVHDDLDFEGVDINIYYCPILANYNINQQEQTGDNVEDALYTANFNACEYLNCKFNFIEGPSGDIGNLSKSILADDHAYDIVYGIQWQIAPLVAKHMFMNFSDNQYIDFEKPWWFSEYIEEAAAGNGDIYILAGDLNLCTLRKASIGIINNDMLNDVGKSPEEIFNAVIDGTWTLDMLYTLTNNMYSDLNGNGEYDENDRYGIACYTASDIDHYIIDSGIRVTKRDADGVPELIFNNENTVSCIEKVYKIFRENEGMYYRENAPIQNMLAENRVLFLNLKFTQLEVYRDIETSFSVIPMPKLNETIDRYGALVHDDTTIVCVPYNCQKIDAVAPCLELLSYEGYNNVIPQYYDVSLKVKYNHDDNKDASAMIDMIHDSITTDFGYVYNYALNNIVCDIRSISSSKSFNFASYYAKKESKTVTKFAELLEAMG